MPTKTKRTHAARGPVSTLQEMQSRLHYLMRKRMGRRYNPRMSYRMCDLWNTDNPPDTLECTSMANRLDALVGFALSEEELMYAYDLEELSDSALYLYNVMQQELTAKKALEDKPQMKSNKKASKA